MLATVSIIASGFGIALRGALAFPVHQALAQR